MEFVVLNQNEQKLFIAYEECILANTKLLNKQTYLGHINCNDIAESLRTKLIKRKKPTKPTMLSTGLNTANLLSAMYVSSPTARRITRPSSSRLNQLI